MSKNNIPVVSDSDTAKAAEAAKYNGVKNFVYVGPSLPGGRLKSNVVLIGTYAEIMEYHKEAVSRYPGVERLFVPVSSLADAKAKLQNGGNALSKYYQDVAAKIRTKGD